ncbi:hypothetical protein, partial [Cecembia sp.]|uniref:hypothetical protein n=1 Tax=Cecembia sp. TaxID=1898110 RepID=UPI0025C6D1B1
GIPLNKLKESAEGIFFPEYTFMLYYPLQNSPVDLGLNIGIGTYQTKLEKRRDLYQGYNDEMRLRRNKNLLSLMGFIRYNFNQEAKFIPFLEAQLGTNYFYTRYKIKESWDSVPIEEGRDQSNWVMAYRIGGGLKFSFKNREKGHWEFKALYHESTPAKFLRKQDTLFNPDKGDGDLNTTYSEALFIFFSQGLGLFCTLVIKHLNSFSSIKIPVRPKTHQLY